MHMFIQNVRVSLDLSLDDANLLVAMLKAYGDIKHDRADRLTDDARQTELNGANDATCMAMNVENQIDERIIEIERKLQAFHDAGMDSRDWLPGALDRMEERFRATEDECSRLDDIAGWDTVEGGAAFTRGGE